MNNLKDSLNDDHLKLVESINNRVGSIYKQLCEYEESISQSTIDSNSTTDDYGESYNKIMDLLESLEDIQEAAQMLRPHNITLRHRQEALTEQMKCLEQSVHLLRLETGTVVKKGESMDE